MIRTGLTDIHCHIIPGVDDGARSMKEAQKMVQIAYEEGTRRIIGTPHYGNRRAKASRGTILLKYMELKAWVKENYPDMEVYLGQELFYRHGIEQHVRGSKAMTMAGSRYVLVEFEPEEFYGRIRQGLEAVQMEGYWQILAHAERYRHLMEKPEHIQELIHMGVFIQVNARSVTGENGWKSKSYAKRLLKNEWVHFIASDGHDTIHRQPSIQKAMMRIARRYGSAYARRLTIINPGKIIKNIYID